MDREKRIKIDDEKIQKLCGGNSKKQSLLLLTSYCDSNPDCTDELPCLACLQMCNIVIVDNCVILDNKGGWYYNRGRNPLPRKKE